MKKITKETYINWYKDMLFWRKFEDKLAALYIQQKVRGFLHLYNGQEAVLAGALHVMKENDKMITAYRNHVQPIGLGVDPKRVMAELLGKVTGTSKGMGGSMHIFSPEHNFYGGHGIVGGQIPLGAGLAFADKYFERDGVTLTYFGDGAARQGSLHETFNMAINWKLPVVFICENNGLDFKDFVSSVRSYVNDIVDRHQAKTFVYFKGSELCDFTQDNFTPLRLNDKIDSFKIIHTKNF